MMLFNLLLVVKSLLIYNVNIQYNRQYIVLLPSNDHTTNAIPPCKPCNLKLHHTQINFVLAALSYRSLR